MLVACLEPLVETAWMEPVLAGLADQCWQRHVPRVQRAVADHARLNGLKLLRNAIKQQVDEEHLHLRLWSDR